MSDAQESAPVPSSPAYWVARIQAEALRLQAARELADTASRSVADAARIQAETLKLQAAGHPTPCSFRDLAKAAEQNMTDVAAETAAVAAENEALRALVAETARAVIRLTQMLVEIRYGSADDDDLVRFHNGTLRAIDDAINAVPSLAAPAQPPFPLPDEETIARRRAEIRDECAAIRREAA